MFSVSTAYIAWCEYGIIVFFFLVDGRCFLFSSNNRVSKFIVTQKTIKTRIGLSFSSWNAFAFLSLGHFNFFFFSKTNYNSHWYSSVYTLDSSFCLYSLDALHRISNNIYGKARKQRENRYRVESYCFHKFGSQSCQKWDKRWWSILSESAKNDALTKKTTLDAIDLLS